MYEINRIYIWKNQVGEYTHLNGVETTVTGTKVTILLSTGGKEEIWPTDTEVQWKKRRTILFAHAGDLRPKFPPAGEKSILALFSEHRLETV